MEKPPSGTLSRGRGKREMVEHTLVPTLTFVTTAHISLAKAMYPAMPESTGQDHKIFPQGERPKEESCREEQQIL